MVSVRQQFPFDAFYIWYISIC